MRILFSVCVGLSLGVTFGFIGRAILSRARRDGGLTEEQRRFYHRLWKAGSRILAWVTSFLLILGLIWCAYFLILGVADPGRADYANNMSELIVSVLTVVSIVFAFYEFVRKK